MDLDAQTGSQDSTTPSPSLVSREPCGVTFGALLFFVIFIDFWFLNVV